MGEYSDRKIKSIIMRVCFSLPLSIPTATCIHRMLHYHEYAFSGYQEGRHVCAGLVLPKRMHEKWEGRGMLFSVEPGLLALWVMRPVVRHPGTFPSLPRKVSHPEVTEYQ